MKHIIYTQGALDNALSHSLVLGGPVKSRESDSVIFMDHLKLEICHDSMLYVVSFYYIKYKALLQAVIFRSIYVIHKNSGLLTCTHKTKEAQSSYPAS